MKATLFKEKSEENSSSGFVNHIQRRDKLARSNFRGNKSNKLVLVNYKLKTINSKRLGTQFMIYKSENKNMYPKLKNYLTISQNNKSTYQTSKVKV